MRVAILGMGSIGKRHAANVKALGHEVIAYDPDIQVQEATKDEYLTCATMRDVWAQKPEAVLVCSPPWLHIEQAAEAIEHGCHVFIEKPLCHSLQEAKALAEMLEHSGLVSMVGCNWRFAHGPQQIKRWLIAGILGEILSVRLYCGYSIDEQKGYKRSYVAKTGAVLDIGAHLLDLAIDWLGAASLVAAQVRAANSIGLPKMDGCAELLIAHDRGTTSSIHVNLLQRHYRHSVEITGREGVVGYHFSDEHIYSRLWGKSYEDYRWNHSPDMFTAEIADFLQCCQEGRPSPNPISQAIKVLEILLKARETACRT